MCHSNEASWKITLGGFYSDSKSSIEAQHAAIDKSFRLSFEDDLNLEERLGTPFLLLNYDINAKHSVYIDWKNLNRKSSIGTVGKDFSFSFNDGETYSVSADSLIETKFNVDVYRIGYGYNIIKNENWQTTLLAGLHVMGFDLSLSGEISLCVDGICDYSTYGARKEVVTQVTAPLPNFGFYTEYTVNEDWRLLAKVQYFSIKLSDIQGSLLDFSTGFEYQLIEKLTAKLTYEYYDIDVDYQKLPKRFNVRYGFKGPSLAITYIF